MQRIGRRIASTAFVAAALLQPALAEPPKFQVDPTWPKPLPNNWIVGHIGGISVDSQDHIWINQRPSTLDAPRKARGDGIEREMLRPGAAGHRIRSGRQGRAGLGRPRPRLQMGQRGTASSSTTTTSSGSAAMPRTGRPSPQVHPRRQVREADRQPGTLTGSNDTTRLGRPADMVVDRANNELYVADGYGNHRVIVFDAATGAYKRHWGAYGKPPTDEKIHLGPRAPSCRSSSPIRCTASACPTTGWCYVCDRGHNRIQVFRKDGTFVKEISRAAGERPGNDRLDHVLAGCGADLHGRGRRPERRVPRGQPRRRQADGLATAASAISPASSTTSTNIGIDSKGNIYTAEVQGKRMQKFRNLGGL